MGEEDSNSNSAGAVTIRNLGRSSNKKQKQKKVPQRGLGVAQLEKIRLQDQHKRILPSSPNKSFFSSSNSILRPQNLDFLNSISGHHGNTSCGVDPGLAFRSAFESNPIWPIPSLMQTPTPPCSMVNVSSSSLLNLHMELPSNQSYYGNYSPFWPEEERTVGMKRPYPFALDNPPAPYHCKFPPFVHPIARSDESTFSFTPLNPNFREGPSCSDSISEPKPICKKSTKENGIFNGDFLTLAPPALTTSNSKLNYHRCESFDFDSLPCQGSMEDSVLQPAGVSVPNQLQPYYSFLPPAIMQIGQGKKTITTCSGAEVAENIDLNLKL